LFLSCLKSRFYNYSPGVLNYTLGDGSALMLVVNWLKLIRGDFKV
jgi:hypothetical protein